MKFAGILEAGRVDGILTESKYVKGTYIVVETLSARNSIGSGVKVYGTICYVQKEGKEYRWTAANEKDPESYDSKTSTYIDYWKYIGDGVNVQSFPDDFIYGLQSTKGNTAQWVKIDSAYIIKALQENNIDLDYYNEVRENLNTLQETVGGFDDRIKATEQAVAKNTEHVDSIADQFNGLEEELATTDKRVDNLHKDIDDIRTSPVGTFRDQRLMYGKEWAPLIEQYIEVPPATEERVGGITSAPESKHPETLTEPGKQGWIRYFISVGNEENEEQNPDLHYAFVDVNPSEAVMDENILRRTLLENPDILVEALQNNENQVINEAIAPAITEVNGNTEGWWEVE